MFKKQWLCLLLAFACAFGCIGANAAEVDSDATYCFTQEDFSQEAGLRGICVTALPDAQAGTVMLGTRVIRVGDILTAEQVQKMTFLPLDTETDVTATITYLPIFQDRVEEAATMTISIRSEGTSLHSPLFRPDYSGGFDHGLVELSDCLSSEFYKEL